MRCARVLSICLTIAVGAALASAAGDEKPTETSVLWALRWLAHHQAPDGRWDAKSYDAQCKLNRCDGPGDAARAPAATGLALLAFLGAGQTQQFGPNKAAIQSGLDSLAGAQDADGFVGDPKAEDALAGHAVAALALTESRGMTGSAKLEAPAQKAVDALFKSPAAAGPWRADFAKDGAVKPEALAWAVCVLKSAEMSKLAVDGEALKRVVVWFEARTDAKTGAVTDPATKRADDVLTATGVLVRAFSGRSPKTDPAMSAAAASLAKSVPPDPAAPLARHFAALAMFIGSKDPADWTRWSAAAKTALEKSQRMEPDRDERGSWDPKDDSVKAGGRLLASALSCLTLQVVSRR